MTASYFCARCGLSRGTDRALARATTTILSGALVLALGACKDSVVPYFTAPTSVPASVTGIQNAVTGLFSASRNDQHYYLIYTSAMARDALVFLSFDPGFVTELGGTQPPSNSDYTSILVWNNEFTDAKQANEIVAASAKVSSYTAAQVAAITGMMQTIKAMNFMMLAETRDTLGIPIYAVVSGASSPPYCNKDVWQYIVALLDSGNANLNTAGAIPLPVVVPPGFSSVGHAAGPSTVQGSFAAFNRALAAKAGLEYAYAIARTPSGGPSAPTPTSAGSPNVPALTRADSAMLASALYNPAAIAPPVNGPFPLDPFGVYHTYSAQSGDLQNPLNVFYTEMAPMYDLVADVDTVNDLRWKNKFTPNAVALQEPPYNATGAPFSFVPSATPNGPEPIVRVEELALVRAEIQLGLGNLAAATTLINTVHQQAGGFATPLTIASTYTAVRDTLMKELRISTVLDGSADHLIAIRMYGLAAVSDTTWLSTSGPDAAAVAGIGGTPTDLHTTITPVPVGETQSRGGNYTLSCS
jgi:starch-binding outer membrane protein, SusD/RagB family